MRLKRLPYAAILLLLAAGLAVIMGCRGGGAGTVSETGTVKYVDLEGGFYGIVGDDGKQYDPINLAREFQRDGLKVRFEARIRDDLASTHMWGTIVEITKIEVCPT